MISAITNPFLYSCFNETFKDGLHRLFSSCCPRMNREINQVAFDAAEYKTNKIKLEKLRLSYQHSSAMYTQSSFACRPDVKDSISASQFMDEPSTRICVSSSNDVLTPISCPV